MMGGGPEQSATRSDPVTDYEEIYRTVAQYEFGWETMLGLNLAFYRTFGIPAIAELLYSTGEMTERTRKRADDTGLLMDEMITNGLESEQGRTAVRRLNQIRCGCWSGVWFGYG